MKPIWENIIASLSEISENFLSHPDYPYRKHIKNVAESFEDESHKLSALFHDFGKLSDNFQTYIRNPSSADKAGHSIYGALLFLLASDMQLNSETFPIFYSVLSHHSNLRDVCDHLDSAFIDYDKHIEKLYDILSKINIAIPEPDDDKLFEIFYEHTYFENIKGIDTYFHTKEIFSKLIFADKHEATFKQSFVSPPEEDFSKYSEILEKIINAKNNHSASCRNNARIEVLNNYRKNKNKCIYIIEAPTGLGKTFMSLHLALEIAKNKNKKKIISALPMTSIIDQTHDVYSEIFPENLLLKYHYLTNPKDYSKNKSENEINYRENSYINSSWSQDKVIITTFNQILGLMFSNKNKDITKFWNLRDSVIIMDEVQNIPRILLRDVAEVINFLTDMLNADFIMMSATLPAIGKLLNKEKTAHLLSKKYYKMNFNNRYTLKYLPEIDSNESATNKILDLSEKNRSVLAVVNTKKSALDIYTALSVHFGKKELFMLTTNHIPAHRQEILRNVRRRLQNSEKVILVSTQVIEAGVDVDFDIGLREFAPLSSIIQTAGRINREGNKNNSILYITEQLGEVSPYDSKDILKTEVQELLKYDVQEKDILPLLKKYFSISLSKTNKDPILIKTMEKLEFEETAYLFNQHFMKKIPDIVQVFIEIENGLYEKFADKYRALTNLSANAKNLKDKLETKEKIRRLRKDMSQYIINVRYDSVKNLNTFRKDSDLFFCPYVEVENGTLYTKEKGWNYNDEAIFI